MSEQRKGIPEGASAVIPRLFCRDPVAEIEFCTVTFGAEEGVRRPGADGKIAHALIMFGPAMVMIESEWPEATNRAPAMDGSSSVALYVYVQNVDETVERAVSSGARILMPATNQFWGDRTAWILDPSGHVWTVATRIEETTEEQRHERLQRLYGKSNLARNVDRGFASARQLCEQVAAHRHDFVHKRGFMPNNSADRRRVTPRACRDAGACTAQKIGQAATEYS